MTITPTVETGLNLLREVMAGICAHPEMLDMEVRPGQVMQVAISAHPTDSRRLVGRGGAHFHALGQLANLLLDGQGRRVSLLPITSPEAAEEPWKVMMPNPDWPQAKVVDLVRRLAEQVFPEEPVQIEVVRHDARTSRIEIYLLSIREWHGAVRKFAESMSVLMIPYGSALGQRLAFNLTTGAPRDELENRGNSAGSTARPDRTSRLPRPEPVKAVEGTSGGHDGIRRVGGLRL